MEEHIILDEQTPKDYVLSGNTIAKFSKLSSAFLITAIVNLVTTVFFFFLEYSNSIYRNTISHIITIILAIGLIYAAISLKRFKRDNDPYYFDMYAKHINNYWITIWIVFVLLIIVVGVIVLISIFNH